MLRKRSSAIALFAMVVSVLIIISVAYSQPNPSRGDARAFFRSLAGEWVGTCEQTTDGEPAENKYFHAIVKQIDNDIFESRFEYYRFDTKSRTAVRAGDAVITTTIGPDGIARSKATGQGTVLVNNQPKNQKHELSEVLSYAENNSMQGQGSGTIKVSGMPFGLGRNGKIDNATTTWSLNSGVMTVHQTLKAGFRALFFMKHFEIVAHYSAKRGSDIAGLIKRDAQVAAQEIGGRS